MSTTIGKRSLDQAIRDAADFQELIRGFGGEWNRWIVAGSCRRECAQVGDIEHVVIPREGQRSIRGGLFAESEPAQLVFSALDRAVEAGAANKHLYNGSPRWGQRYRGVDFRGFNHEIFIADEDNFGPTLAIRTGPADFSRMLVTKMREQGYRNRDGYVWNIRDWSCACGWVGDSVEYIHACLAGGWTDKLRDGTEMIATCLNCGRHEGLRPARISVPTEEKYFEICGVPFVPPRERRA